MKDFVTKIDDNPTDAGVVVADEYNSIFDENKNAVKTFIPLNGADNKQMQKAIDIATKAMLYTDAGTPNSVVLSRSATTETTETLFDGMAIMFAPANANTGATTLKVNTLIAKDLKYNGLALTAGFLATDSKYIAIYSVANSRFDVDLLVNYKNLNDAISGIDLSAKADKTEVIGISQTVQDVKASRAIGTIYTNTTGKPIVAFISIDIDSLDKAHLFIDGVQVAESFNNVTAGTNPVYSHTLIIPNNSTYQVTTVSGSPVIYVWSELR